ncbi:MAG: Gfo/Idh/MocA family oxidoreductase [Bacteroides sp.]|nr:Gfo/Idh/MocA family oxidoreductase [Bacteroides sp.]
MKKIRFGVVGTNNISDWVIAGGRQDERFELVAVCSRTQEKANEFAAKHSIPHTFTSLEEMAKSTLIDAVYIATPNYVHAHQSILCMSHGKHVLCEKPFASNAHEVRQMITAARQYGVVLMEAMISTLNPNFAIVKDHLKDLGTIRRYFASYCQYSSRYDKFKEGIILNAFKPELSNGAVMDIGVYTIYPMVVLFGKPQKVEAQGILLHTGVDGQGAVNFQYEGMNATVLYSKIANSALPTEIEGEAGNLILDKIHITKSVDFIPRQVTGQGQEQANIPHAIGVTVDKSPYYHEMAEFMNLIEQGRQESSVNSWENSLTTIEIMDEIRQQLGVHYPADIN